ncbi:MAG: protein translocase subunit SecF [Hyphomicrobiaceae bacterium]|nr:protein translocase subunit SecF [Hyphomicrobiaceae bacterium]
MKLLRLVPDNTKIPFMRARHATLALSIVMCMAAFAAFGALGLNFGIDFTGGTLIELRNKTGAADIAKVRAEVGELNLGDVQVQTFGQPQDILVRVPQQDGGELAQQATVEKVRVTLGEAYDVRRVEVVGPSVSADLRRDGTIAVIISLMGVLVYLWFRFEWQFAIGAVLTTMHDLCVVMLVLVAFQITFDLTILAAVLTILGYSLNDTVVIYDRIRENMRKYKSMPLPELIDLSINSTLSRTVATTMTTFLAVLALFIFGGEVLRGFNFTMLIGILIGIYSSVVISAPLLIYLKLRALSDRGQTTDKETAKALKG